jgi:hypothetical protein
MAKSAKMMKAKEANDTKAKGKGVDPKKPMTKNNVKALAKLGKKK